MYYGIQHRVEHGTYWCDECYQVAPEGQRQYEYDQCMHHYSDDAEEMKHEYYLALRDRVE